MKIIVAALKEELNKVFKVIKPECIYNKKNKKFIYKKLLPNGIVYFLITGIGRKNINELLKYFIQQFKPDKNSEWILVGYAGGLNNNLLNIVRPGIVMQNEQKIKFHNNNDIMYCDNKIFYYKDKLSLKKINKKILAVNMESFYFVSYLLKNGFKNIDIIKIITDKLTSNLPPPNILRYIFPFKIKNIFKILPYILLIIKLKIILKKATKILGNYLLNTYL